VEEQLRIAQAEAAREATRRAEEAKREADLSAAQLAREERLRLEEAAVRAKVEVETRLADERTHRPDRQDRIVEQPRVSRLPAYILATVAVLGAALTGAWAQRADGQRRAMEQRLADTTQELANARGDLEQARTELTAAKNAPPQIVTVVKLVPTKPAVATVAPTKKPPKTGRPPGKQPPGHDHDPPPPDNCKGTSDPFCGLKH